MLLLFFNNKHISSEKYANAWNNNWFYVLDNNIGWPFFIRGVR